MFDMVVLRRAESGSAVSVGQVAEGLLFYQRVHLILDGETLRVLLQSLGPDGLIDLLSRDDVSAVHCEGLLATHQHSQPPWPPIYGFVSTLIAGHVDQPELKLNTRKKRLVYWLIRWGMTKDTALEFVERLIPLLPERKFENDDFVPGGVTRAAMLDVADESFLHSAVATIMESHSISHPPFKFQTRKTPRGMELVSDMNFSEISQQVPDLTPSMFLTQILSARADISLAAHYAGDFRTSAITSSLIQIRHSELLRRAGIHARELEDFRRIVLTDFPTVQETIDSGARTFIDFLLLLEKAKRFRKFLADVGPDERVVGEYLKEVGAEGWINKLPTKVARYVIGQAIDAAAPLVGQVFSGADGLILEKVFGGWKPNHFVDTSLAPFVDGGGE